MKKIGLMGVVAGAMTAAVIGFAGPAQADAPGLGAHGHHNDYGYNYGYGRDHRNNPWINQLVPSVNVPHVDTSVHH